MSIMAGEAGTMPWGNAERAGLKAARKHAKHSPEAFAQLLHEEFGGPRVTQPTLSRWESGGIGRPDCVPALVAYTDAYGTHEINELIQVEHAEESGPTTDALFDSLAQRVSGEPLLGPLQSQLIGGISERLQHGPPMSTEDRATFLDLLRVLGVEPG
jgi:hypothetical protein